MDPNPLLHRISFNVQLQGCSMGFKIRTDGTVRWCMAARSSVEEPGTVDEALYDKNWAVAMESEHQALLKNKT